MADQPLAARMRPRSFEEFVGQSHLVGPGKVLSKLVAGGHLPSIVLWGPAGTGKTTLAHLLADAVDGQLTQLSAVSSGVADARKVMEGARGGLFRTILFVDEVHRWSKNQQDVLLPAVEEGTITLIGATTENPYFSLNTPLLSRCLLLRLEPLTAEDLRALLRRALEDADRGLGGPRRHGDRRRARAPGGDRRRRRQDGAHRPRGGGARGVLGRLGGGDARPRGRRRPAQGRRVRPAGRRALRRDLRVHQVDPRLRPRRRPVLAGADARGGRGPPLHRAADDRARLRGHRARRSRALLQSRSRPRTPSSTWGCPRPA